MSHAAEEGLGVSDKQSFLNFFNCKEQGIYSSRQISLTTKNGINQWYQ